VYGSTFKAKVGLEAIRGVKTVNEIEREGGLICLLCRLPGGSVTRYGAPEIFNSDQGSPFTNEAFVGVLEAQGVRIGMEGRGRALDNVFVVRLWRSVTYEDIYLKAYAGVPELLIGLSEYFERDNPLSPINRWATPLPSLSIGRGRAVVPVSWTSIQ
jgi:transposase InsO family protein